MTSRDDARARRTNLGSVPRIPSRVPHLRLRAGLARILAGEAARAAKVARAARRASRRDKGTPGAPTPHGAG